LVFDNEVTTKKRSVDEVIKEAEETPHLYNDLLMHIIDIAKSDDDASRSWPTLLKSQAFFEKVASFLKGRASIPQKK
jgi:hypothetical protein